MKPIKLRLADIKILRSGVRDHPIVFNEEFSLKDVILDVESKFIYRENYVQFFSHFHYELKHNDNNIALGHFDIVYTFDVPNLQEILQDPDLKKALQLNILALSYSTSRGIIYCETKGYAINEIYLDITSPNELYNSIVENESVKAEEV